MSSEETKEIQAQENSFSYDLASNLDKKIMNLHATNQRFDQSL